jgi:hypothetical protein
MSEMEAAKAALRKAPLNAEQFKRIRRMHANDKVLPSKIAEELELDEEHVLAALWKPAPAKSAYMMFQASKTAEVNPKSFQAKPAVMQSNWHSITGPSMLLRKLRVWK